MSNDLVCVDLSHWQNEPDWGKLKASGVSGVILKATEGTGYVDDTFARRYDDAKEAGFVVSTYHFLKHGKAKDQMAFYLSKVDPEEGERVVVDYEDTACTLDDLHEAVQALLDDPRKLQVTVYGANGFLGAQLAGKRDALLADNTALWVASYTTASAPTTTNLKGTWPVWSLWQYTDKATVSGVSGGVDGNRFNGSVEDFVKWMGPPEEDDGTKPEPPPEPQPDERPYVTIKVASSEPIYLVIEASTNVEITQVTPSVEK